jgi:class 3 adenylate cyclase
VCAVCAHLVENLRELEQVHSQFTCDFCWAENDVSLDDYIHVSFTISPAIRPITYHQPDSLPIEDYYFKYHFSRDTKPYGNGMMLSEILGYITRYMTFVQPGETQTFSVEEQPGMLQVKDLKNSASMVLFLDETKDETSMQLGLTDGRFQTDSPPLAPQTVKLPIATFKFPLTSQLPNGRIDIEYTNHMNRPSPLWILHYPAAFEGSLIEFEPFLSGHRLLTNQTFRDLFRSETIQSDEGLGIKDLTLLFTDLKGSTEMYDRIGDLNAFYLVRQHFDYLNKAIVENSGAVVKTIGDAVMAAFTSPVDALNAALAMLDEIADFNLNNPEAIILKIGIHRGHSIAVTQNDSLDYFGQTVNIAARIQGLAGGGEIYLSENAYDYPGVAERLKDYQVTADEVGLKGVQKKLKVYKVIM